MPECPFHLARCEYPSTNRFPSHTHDFAEITWIESGTGKQIINGSVYLLKQGDLFFIRPADFHSFEAGTDGLTLINLAFPADIVTELERRYFPNTSCYFQTQEKFPWSTHLDAESFTQVAKLFSTLAGTVRDRLELDRALLTLFSIVRRPFMNLPFEDAPDWLRCACAEMQRPAHLAEGIPALIRFAGRSPEHTSRELRKYSGITPTEFINRLRLDHAARLLCTSGHSILETALECGFENQGHFHRCFKTRFGTTPLKYRKQNLAPVF